MKKKSRKNTLFRILLSMALAVSLVPGAAFAQKDAGAENTASTAAASVTGQSAASAYGAASTTNASDASASQALYTWDVSSAQDGSVQALLFLDDSAGESAASAGETAGESAASTTSETAGESTAIESASYTLCFQGTGAIRDFLSAAELPYAAFASNIKSVEVESGVTTLGSYCCALPSITTVCADNTLAIVNDYAFDQAKSLFEFDFSYCTLTSFASNAFGLQTQSQTTTLQRSVYVRDAASALLVQAAAQTLSTTMAVAVMNGGHVPVGYEGQVGVLPTPVKEGYTFSTWTSDEALMHPCSVWTPVSKYILYARFTEIAKVEDPEPYKGAQGLDQTITLYDTAQLPSTVVNPDVLFYGESDTAYQNKFQTAFNGNQQIEFAYGMGRGNNANGGDGSYQISFSLSYISVLDETGNVVANYNEGNGLLHLAGIVFDGEMDKSTGYSIYAIRLSLDANTLAAGTYTLRFGKDIGANNGISFLGKNVDFTFTVEYPKLYELSYSYNEQAKTASVVGVTVSSANTAVDVVIPQTVESPTGQPCTVTSIEAGAFANQALVASVDVPASVSAIGNNAFANMSALESVTVRSNSDVALPSWGDDVFTGSGVTSGEGTGGSSDTGENAGDSTDGSTGDGSDAGEDASPTCYLYGYTTSTCANVAKLYSNVTFVSLDNGIYVNGEVFDEKDTLEFSSDCTQATITIMQDGANVTSQYRGYITNTRVASHAGTSPSSWNVIQAVANGTAELKITSLTGETFATIAITVAGQSEYASLEPSVCDAYQGNGCTVRLLKVSGSSTKGGITTVDYDETLTYFCNALTNSVPAVGATFSLDISGPGSAWGPVHSGWNWQGFLSNIEGNLHIENAEGQVVATFGAGLTWKTLTTSNTVEVAVDKGILEPEKTYRLIAGEGFSGHNAQAKLLKAVSWEFTTAAVDVSTLELSSISPQLFSGAASEPSISVSLPAYAQNIWDDENSCVVTTQIESQALELGADYTVTYKNNTAPGTAQVVIQGQGMFSGSATKDFLVYMRGDVNTNGVLNIVDALIAYDIANGMYVAADNYADLCLIANVVGEDDVVDANDAFAIQYAVCYGWVSS